MGTIIEAADLKAYLGKDTGASDALIDLLVEGVSARIETFIGHPIGETQHTGERFTGNGEDAYVVLRNGPIISVDSVTLNGIALLSTEYRFDDRLLIRTSTSGVDVAWGSGQYVVGYWAGYSDIPADLRLACMTQCAYEYKKSGGRGDRLGLTSRAPAVDGEAQSFLTDAWEPSVLQTIRSHRRLL